MNLPYTQTLTPRNIYVRGKRGGKGGQRCGYVLWRGGRYDLNTLAKLKGVSRECVYWALENWMSHVDLNDFMNLSWRELKRKYRERKAAQPGTLTQDDVRTAAQDAFNTFARRKLT